MTLSDLSVRRPVLATVFSLIIIAFGAIAFTRLPLRELPDVDRPIVSINATYPGASAQVVENQITRPIEDQLSGIDGIDTIYGTSRDGRSSVTIEFSLDRNLEDATNDVRNAVDRARGQLPAGIDDPTIRKADADADAIIWFSLESTTLDRMALTDYADRYIVDRLAVLNGVASVQVGGGFRRALKIWLDTNAMAARGITVQDVENALRAQNVELPAGNVQSQERDYQIRIARAFETPEQFQRLPLTDPGGADENAVVRLGDIARVEYAPEEVRSLFRGNGVEQVGLGIVRQSRSNALEVGREVKQEIERIRPELPEGTNIVLTYDATLFIDRAIQRVGQSLLESTALVVFVIFLFLGSWRAAFIPAAVIPVCLIGSFLIMLVFGFSINLLTLLALVLAIGLVVDDSIVVLENVQRRVDTLGEPPLVAAERGTRQVFFAVVATSAVLVAVFLPLLFVGGYVGKLFVELAITIAGVVVISAFCSLSLSPMMCSKLVKSVKSSTWLTRTVDGVLDGLRASYRASLEMALNLKPLVFLVFGGVMVIGGVIFSQLSTELTPPEDRGNLVIQMQAPEGAGFEYTSRVMHQVEAILMSYVESGEAQRILIVAPGFGDAGTNRFSSGIGRMFLANWEDRHRSGMEIESELNQRFSQIPGATVRARMQSAFQSGGGGGGADGVSIVLLGSTYEQLSAVADRMMARMRDNPHFQRPRMNYQPTSPRVLVQIDRERAAALGVSVQAVGRTLEATMGSRRVNTITDRGEEYYVYLQAERDERSDVADLTNKFVRSDRTGELIPLATLVTMQTVGDSAERRRMNRQAAVTISASIPGDYAIGDALNELERVARAEIGDQPITLDYTGAARQYKQSTGAIVFAFGFALIVVFLVLAAQFESFVHPLVIMLAVPLAVTGGLFGLFLFDNSLNIYSEIGLIILIALSAKNGILIVEFANQMRDEGKSIRDAILEAADLRVRPVLMTSIATVVGSLPLILGHGAGAESRSTIGVVIFFGLTVATMLTLFVVPVFYDLLARFTKSPEATAKEIEAYEHGQAIARPAE
ncbi:efflux RND transporter permease subunit [Terricaulis sp.]|uniref:efflux RND transporter permease subunit n=1 Tax=Terricaulis sp. TaxID=2768686 RepID=UPI0037831C01